MTVDEHDVEIASPKPRPKAPAKPRTEPAPKRCAFDGCEEWVIRKWCDEHRRVRNNERVKNWRLDRRVRETGDVSGQHLYIIGDATGPVKIGVARHPHERVGELQTGNPRRLTLLHVEHHAGNLEKLLHSLFADFHLQGEWFDFGDQDAVALIRTEIDRLSVYRRVA